VKRSQLRAFFASVALLFGLLATTSAHAERILMIEEPTMLGLGARLRAELVALEFDVVTEELLPLEPMRESLEAATRVRYAVAAMRVLSAPPGVEVWVMDRATGKAVLRESVLSAGDDESIVAVGAVELLRASLLEVHAPDFVPRNVPPPSPAPSPPPPARPPPVSVPAQPRRFWLALGPALAISPGGLGLTPHVDLGASVRRTEALAIVARFIAPTVPARVDAPEGHASILLSAATLGADLLLASHSSSVRPRVGAGVGVLWVHMEGDASGAFIGRGDAVLSALGTVHGGLLVRLGDGVRLFFDATLALAAPRPVARFADRQVASWGQPALLSTVGLQVALF
jgi:hypothetical protein